jgi:hypothetical protein
VNAPKSLFPPSMDDAAKQLFALYNAMVKAGFDEDRAERIIAAALAGSLKK